MTQTEMFDPISADAFDVAKLGAADMREARHRWPQRLAELFDVQLAYALRSGMDPETAERDATERTFLIADYIGGRLLYIPSGEKLRIAVRDLQMARAQGRVSVDDLARRHSLSQQQVYNILTEQSRLVVDRMQGKLFTREGTPIPAGLRNFAGCPRLDSD